MIQETHDAEFTEELRQFLMKVGFTFILSSGADDTQNGPDGGVDNYWLIPLRNDDPRIKYEETDYIVQEITSNEVLEMTKGVEFINFIVKVPVYFYEIYVKKNQT